MTMTTIQAPTSTTVLRAEGFSCPSCVAKIERQVGRLPGVTSVTVHFASARIEIEHDRSVTDVAELVAAVAKAGYTARPAAF
jgi:copper chaperone CopZ